MCATGGETGQARRNRGPERFAAPVGRSGDREHARCATAALGPLARGTANHPARERPPGPTLNPACPRTTTCGSYLARDPARVAPLRVDVRCALRPRAPSNICAFTSAFDVPATCAPRVLPWTPGRPRTRALRYRGSGPTRSGDSEPPARERPPGPTLNPACPRTTTCGSYLARNPTRVAPLRVDVRCALRPRAPSNMCAFDVPAARAPACSHGHRGDREHARCATAGLNYLQTNQTRS